MHLRRRHLLLAAALLVLLLVPVILATRDPGAGPPAAIPVATEAPEPVVRSVAGPPPDADPDDLVAEAAAGTYGVAYRNRVCRACRSGAMDDPGCAQCPEGEAPLGRVVVDIVDEQGRQYPPHETSVHVDCSNAAVITSGHMDLPVGRCVLKPVRVDGLLDVVGDPVEVEVTEDGEQYVLVEIPSAPWGAAGVDLVGEGGEVVVRGLIPGTAAHDAIPAGARLLQVDGVDVGGRSAAEIARELNGPVGSTVSVRFEHPDTGEAVQVEIPRSRLDNAVVDPHMVPG
ncbi:MAG: PDZ domain-containing protein [Alphaproteobacteria bacterium]|nr:PDZ domain-containing protein [Alphaproteobacteria bacterium]MCB9691308.1 PDZ domain-containing protein [Alphaproteobacteria bacterium]